MNDSILPQIAKTDGLDDAEPAGVDEELKLLIRQTLPSGYIDAHDLFERVRRGDPAALIQWKDIDNRAFFAEIERKPGELETLWTRVAAEWERAKGLRCEVAPDVESLMKMACEVLVLRDGRHRNEFGFITARSIIKQASRRATDLARSSPTVRRAKWFWVATDELLTAQMLRQAHADGRLRRSQPGRYATDDVCRVWPEHQALIELSLSKESEKAAKSVEKRRTQS